MSQTLATTADAAQAVTSKGTLDISAFAGMFGGLLLVLLIIFALAYLLKRLNLVSGTHGVIKTLAQTPVGPKERLVLAELDGQQYLLGVTSSQITLLDKLQNPVTVEANSFANRLKLSRQDQQ
ncbi:flagellar biosynthetic protein FliO [Shewanella yunxiaonensis]|uniref:Flagellar protein n=1 Tax=Shewanella yunxiaonensis TaxID=2829809 RepID=A0ABX7YW01_9GAMM|nr:flagellar biosynthetic protein FliO [Shewanella yunxiaonensis]QUN06862.1 flagellar biosynthetic protein FliO [Shewanella yunxiaonensis]